MATKTKSKKSIIKKSSAKKPVVVTKAAVSKTNAKTKDVSPKVTTYKMKKPQAILLIVILASVALIYALRSFIVAATVNGQPISRLSVVKEAEKQAGKQVLDILVRNTLVEQEAKKQKVTISDKEIKDEIKKAEESLAKQGRKLSEVMTLQGLTMEDVKREIRFSLLLTKLVGRDVKVTEKEIDEYIVANSETLPQDQTAEQIRKTVKDQLTQQALSAKVQGWLAELQKKAKIQYLVSY